MGDLGQPLPIQQLIACISLSSACISLNSDSISPFLPFLEPRAYNLTIFPHNVPIFTLRRPLQRR